MFGKLMDSIDDDYLRYVMHVQVIAAPSEDPDYAQADFVAADDPAAGLGDRAPPPSSAQAPESTRARHRLVQVPPGPQPARASAAGPRPHRPPSPGAGPAGRRQRPGFGTASAVQGSVARPAGPDLADGDPDRRRPSGQGGPQRALLVRQRPQVQGLPRRELNDHGSSNRRCSRWPAP